MFFGRRNGGAGRENLQEPHTHSAPCVWAPALNLQGSFLLNYIYRFYRISFITTTSPLRVPMMRVLIGLCSVIEVTQILFFFTVSTIRVLLASSK